MLHEYESTSHCTICHTDSPDGFLRCSRCVHQWCMDCDAHIDRCPYCRITLRPLGTPGTAPTRIPTGIPVVTLNVLPVSVRMVVRIQPGVPTLTQFIYFSSQS